MRQAGREYAGALSLIGLGAALGPAGLGVLTPQLLALVDPAIPVGLAALGVLAGLELRAPVRTDSRAAIGTAVDLALAGVVGGSAALLALALGVSGLPLRTVAVLTGICAFAARSRNQSLAILVGAAGLASMRGSASIAAWTTGTVTLVAIGCAVAGWLLLRRSSSEREQRAATVAMLLLIGGAADYLAVSALLAGLAAGMSWRIIGGVVAEAVRRDVWYLRHPMLAIVLLTAGAHTELTALSLGVGIGYALVGAVLARLGEAITSLTVAGSSVVAVAFAISALRIAGPEVTLPFAAVVIGTLLSQLFGMARGRTESFE
jgi:hypothetical protein